MPLMEHLPLLLIAGVGVVILIYLIRTPLKLVGRLLLNTALGFLALYILNLTTSFTGLSLGLNLWNALIIGVLGVPGFFLLLLLQWVL